MNTKDRGVRRPELAPSEIIHDLPLACASEANALAFFEKRRWKGSAFCPRHGCGDTNVYRMRGEQSAKRGLWRCRGCNRQFTVRVGTVFEDSKLPLRDWCRAIWGAIKAKNGMSALELKRELQCSYRTALFMLNRLRCAMEGSPNPPKLIGTVEVDEVYLGGKVRNFNNTDPYTPPRNPDKWRDNKTPVVAALQRDGTVRTRIMPSVNAENVKDFILSNIDRTSILNTDGGYHYHMIGNWYKDHWRVRHNIGEFVQKDNIAAHTNSIESFFSRVRRSLDGTYIAVSPEHLHRYLAQFVFTHDTRKMTDGERLQELFSRTEGKRLLYREPEAPSAA